MLIHESHVFGLQVETKFEVCDPCIFIKHYLCRKLLNSHRTNSNNNKNIISHKQLISYRAQLKVDLKTKKGHGSRLKD